MLIDAHEDIAMNVLSAGRDFTQSVAATRAREGEKQEDIATTGLPDALEAGVGVIFGTLFTMPDAGRMEVGVQAYHTAEEAYVQGQAQLAAYRKLAEHPQIAIVETRADLAAVQAAWDAGNPTLGLVMLMENADPIREPSEVAAWYADGVRLVGPAWAGTRYCGGTRAPGPLTPIGRELMRTMSQARMALDVSHLAEESFWQALELFDGQVIASHSNCRALVPGEREDRHLSDDMIRALIERDAVIGVVLYNSFLDSSWTRAQGKAALGLDAVVQHIDHICQIAGNTQHVAIGSDFDGGFGSEAIPRELDSIGDLPRISVALRMAGFSADDAAAVLGNNWLRKLGQILP